MLCQRIVWKLFLKLIVDASVVLNIKIVYWGKIVHISISYSGIAWQSFQHFCWFDKIYNSQCSILTGNKLKTATNVDTFATY